MHPSRSNYIATSDLGRKRIHGISQDIRQKHSHSIKDHFCRSCHLFIANILSPMTSPSPNLSLFRCRLFPRGTPCHPVSHRVTFKRQCAYQHPVDNSSMCAKRFQIGWRNYRSSTRMRSPLLSFYLQARTRPTDNPHPTLSYTFPNDCTLATAPVYNLETFCFMCNTSWGDAGQDP